MSSKKEDENNDEDNPKKYPKKRKKLDPYDRSKVRNLDRKNFEKDNDSDGSYDYRY